MKKQNQAGTLEPQAERSVTLAPLNSSFEPVSVLEPAECVCQRQLCSPRKRIKAACTGLLLFWDDVSTRGCQSPQQVGAGHCSGAVGATLQAQAGCRLSQPHTFPPCQIPSLARAGQALTTGPPRHPIPRLHPQIAWPEDKGGERECGPSSDFCRC